MCSERKPDGLMFPAIVQDGAADEASANSKRVEHVRCKRRLEALVLSFDSTLEMSAKIFTSCDCCRLSDEIEGRETHFDLRSPRSLLRDEAYITPPTLNLMQSLLSIWISLQLRRYASAIIIRT